MERQVVGHNGPLGRIEFLSLQQSAIHPLRVGVLALERRQLRIQQPDHKAAGIDSLGGVDPSSHPDRDRVGCRFVNLKADDLKADTESPLERKSIPVRVE